MKDKQLAWDFEGNENYNDDYDYNLDVGNYNTEWFNIMLEQERFRVILKGSQSFISLDLNFSYYTKGSGNLIQDIQFFITSHDEKMIKPVDPYLDTLNIWADYRDHNINYQLLFPVDQLEIRNDLRFSIVFKDVRYKTYVRKSYILYNQEWLEDELVAFIVK